MQLKNNKTTISRVWGIIFEQAKINLEVNTGCQQSNSQISITLLFTVNTEGNLIR